MKQWSGADLDDPYAELPELYDLEHAGFTEDIDLYLRLAEVVGDPILELGCGTGRVLAPLAAAGNRITGVDRSRPMLDRARSALHVRDKAGDLLQRVTLVEGSMTEAERAPGGPFGMVIFSLNGLMHLSTVAGQRAALASARRALDPRGMLVIDALNPTPETAGCTRWTRPARGVLAEIRRHRDRSILGADARFRRAKDRHRTLV